MPLPSVYTEAVFADYLASVLGEVAPIIAWDAGSVQVLEAVNDTLLDYGTTDLSTVLVGSGMRRLRALGRRAIWRAVVQNVAARYDFRDSDATFSRSQIQEMAQKALAIAEADCLEFSPTYAVSIVKLNRPHDPYVVIPDSERTA